MKKEHVDTLFKITQFSHDEIIKVFKREHKKIVIGYSICLLLFIIGFAVMSVYILPNLINNGIEGSYFPAITYLFVFSLVISFIILVAQKLVNKKKIIEKIKLGEYDFINNIYVLNLIAILNYKALLNLQKKYGK